MAATYGGRHLACQSPLCIDLAINMTVLSVKRAYTPTTCMYRRVLVYRRVLLAVYRRVPLAVSRRVPLVVLLRDPPVVIRRVPRVACTSAVRPLSRDRQTH